MAGNRVADEMTRLEQLYRQGVLTPDQFEAAKAKALAPPGVTRLGWIMIGLVGLAAAGGAYLVLSGDDSSNDPPADPVLEQRTETSVPSPEPADDPFCTEEAAALWPNGLDAEQTLPDTEWDAWMARHDAFTERCGSVGGDLPYIDLDGDGAGTTP